MTRRLRLLLVTALVVAVVALGLVAGLMLTLADAASPAPAHTTGGAVEPDRPSSPAAPTPSPAPSAAPVDEGAPGRVTGPMDAAKAEHLLTVATASLDAGAPLEEAGLGDIAAGAFLGELEAQHLELSAHGWTVTGETRVSEVEILGVDDSGPVASARVRACVDASALAYRDAEGRPVGGPADAPARARTDLTLTDEGGAWRIVSRSFPDDPSC